MLTLAASGQCSMLSSGSDDSGAEAGNVGRSGTEVFRAGSAFNVATTQLHQVTNVPLFRCRREPLSRYALQTAVVSQCRLPSPLAKSNSIHLPIYSCRLKDPGMQPEQLAARKPSWPALRRVSLEPHVSPRSVAARLCLSLRLSTKHKRSWHWPPVASALRCASRLRLRVGRLGSRCKLWANSRLDWMQKGISVVQLRGRA